MMMVMMMILQKCNLDLKELGPSFFLKFDMLLLLVETKSPSLCERMFRFNWFGS
jgi:hypothetical protein